MAGPLIPLGLEQLRSMDSLRASLEALENDFTRKGALGKDLEFISNTTVAIRDFLLEAKKIRFSSNNGRISAWLCKLQDVADDVDDLLDKMNTAELVLEIKKGLRKGGFHLQICLEKVMFSLFKTCLLVLPRRHIACKIKQVSDCLENVVAEKVGFITMGKSIEKERRETVSFPDGPKVYGRDDKKSVLMDMLLGSKSKIDLDIIAIVGMGGVGKSALAQHVFQDYIVRAHFHQRIWVHVGDTFDLRVVATRINDVILGGSRSRGFFSLENLLRDTHKAIKGKRFLLVLDDVWTDDETNWAQLEGCLRNGAVGSRVLVTTRKQQVAIMMQAQTRMIFPELLSEEHAWSMFCEVVSSEKDRDECGELEEIGRGIVKKCSGLPLAIKALGNIMKFKRSKQAWAKILHNQLWKVDGSISNIFSSLLLSYDDLPALQKRCLLYCSIFPKDYKIDRDELIELWMSQGYFKENDYIDTGENCFRSLVMRSFFCAVEDDDGGNIRKWKMHALMHDLVCFLTKEEWFSVDRTSDFGKRAQEEKHATRHFRWSSESAAQVPLSIFNNTKLRTLSISGSKIPTLCLHSLKNLALLRTLCLRGCGIQQLPHGIGKLIHLRYLDLSFNASIGELPNALCDLVNLQTLRIEHCTRLQRLPEGIGKLVKLRHLYIAGCESLEGLPRGIERLSCLQTLDAFIVSADHLQINKVMKLGHLNKLKHLQRCVHIRGLGNIEDIGEAQKAQLRDKEYLHDLKLIYSQSTGPRRMVDELAVILEGLQPHPNLKMLEIRGYLGAEFPSWMVSLISLKRLILNGFHNIEFLPPLGILPSLEYLDIEDMSKVEKVGSEFLGREISSNAGERRSCIVSFRKLKKLRFSALYSWKEWSGNEEVNSFAKRKEKESLITIMPQLVSLEIANCNCLKELPDFLQMVPLQYLSIYCCQNLEKRCEREVREGWLRIAHIPNIKICRC